MNKKANDPVIEEIVQKILEKLEADLSALKQTAKAAHEAATHDEGKAEDQYDTRGLEASYLAGAAAKRSEEISEAILYFQKEKSKIPLYCLKLGSKKVNYILAKKGGGIQVKASLKALFSESKSVVEPSSELMLDSLDLIQVITPDSPLGAELSGRKEGEEFEVEIRSEVKTYQILKMVLGS